MEDYTILLYPAFSILLGLTVIVVPSLFVYDAYSAHVEAENEIEGSMETRGEVLDNNINEYVSEQGQTTSIRYAVSLEYEYQVDGQTYTSQNIYPSDRDVISFSDQYSADQYLNEYSVGDALTIYYQPDDPEESYVEKDVPGLILPIFMFIIFFIGGTVFILLGLYMLRAVFKDSED